MNDTFSHLLDNPWQVLGWITLVFVVGFFVAKAVVFLYGLVLGTRDFLRHFFRHRRDRVLVPEVGQCWTDGVGSEYRITNVFGPNAEEGVNVELVQGPKTLVGSLSKKAWSITVRQNMLCLVDKEGEEAE